MMNVDVIPVDENKEYPEVPVDQVRVYKTAHSAPEGYKVIADLELSVAGDIPEDEDGEIDHRLVDRLVKEAASIGANGVILGKLTRPDGGRVAAAVFVGVPMETTVKAKAILGGKRKAPAPKAGK